MSFLSRVLSKQCTSLYHSQSRLLSTTKQICNYEGDGMTTIKNLNRECNDLLVSSYSQMGFRLNNGTFFVGPIVLFRRSVFQWDVSCANELNKGAFALFKLLEPKVDLLVLGVGDQTQKLPEEVRKYLHEQRIPVEVMQTVHACSTYNFLAADQRHVAALLIPPENLVSRFEADMIEAANLKVSDNILKYEEEMPEMKQKMLKHLEQQRDIEDRPKEERAKIYQNYLNEKKKSTETTKKISEKVPNEKISSEKVTNEKITSEKVLSEKEIDQKITSEKKVSKKADTSNTEKPKKKSVKAEKTPSTKKAQSSTPKVKKAPRAKKTKKNVDTEESK